MIGVATGNNPFAGFGTLVSGDRLVGRDKILRRLDVTVGSGFGSVALIGEPRVGKSSVAKAAMDRAKARDESVTVLWLDLGAAGPDGDLFAILLFEVHASLGRDSNDPQNVGFEAYRSFKAFLRREFGQERRLLVVVDEFDAIRSMDNAALTIRRLRELVSAPHQYGMAAILVSRRRIAVIEEQISNLSTLEGVCSTIYVQPLDNVGLRLMTNRAWPEGISVQDSRQLASVSGKNPYLMEAILYEVVEGSNMDVAVEQARGTWESYFRHLSSLLVEDGLWPTLLAVAQSQLPNASPDLTILENYGVVVRSNHEHKVFSDSYRDYIVSAEEQQSTSWSTDLV